MLNLIRKYPLAVVAALIVHVLFVAVLVLSFDWTARPVIPAKEVDIVKATVVDERAVASELAALRDAEAKKKESETDRVRQLEAQADEARSQREQEQKRIAELESQRKFEIDRKHKAEADRATAEAAARKAQLEQKKIEEQRAAVEAERRRSEDQVRKAKEEVQRAEEQKRRLEDERLAAEAEQRKRAEDDKRRADELVRKQKDEVRRQQEAQRRVEEDEQRRHQLGEDEKRLGDERNKKLQATVGSFVAKIKGKIADHWLRPPTAKEGMSCTVMVRLFPDGNVRDVKVVRSSGDPVFDREVENAVMRSQPLPVPKEPDAFTHFKELQFEFNPKVK